MSHFENDLAKETILGQFLSKQYANAGIHVERIANKEMQLKGVDLILRPNDGLTYKVDEKAQLHYLNQDLPTFALEIDFEKDGILKDGWLYNAAKATEIYAFVFSIHLKETLMDLNKENDIKSCEVIFVKRMKLIDKLSALNIDVKLCKAMSQALRTSNHISKMIHDSGFNFQISKHLSESPVNLTVKKKFLETIGKKYMFSV